jgi:nucleotide-binding universal stress UspA family protein
MVERSHQNRGVPVVLVGIDRSEPAAEAVAIAARIAESWHASLHLVYVVDKAPRSRDSLEVPLRAEELQGAAGDVLERAAAQASTTFRGVQRGHLASGLPSEEIVRLASDLGAELIVVGTHGRSGLRRVLLGSVAEQVLRTASCPVLAARCRSATPSRAASRSVEIDLPVSSV